jgi:hypothetical protein
MKIPVSKETLPLKARVSNSWVKTDGMADASMGRRMELGEVEGVYIGSDQSERSEINFD